MKQTIIMILLVVQFAGAAEKTIEISAPKRKKELEKTPKSLFLVKKTKISSEVGEPQFNPGEAQLRTVINDTTFYNFKNFEK